MQRPTVVDFSCSRHVFVLKETGGFGRSQVYYNFYSNRLFFSDCYFLCYFNCLTSWAF